MRARVALAVALLASSVVAAPVPDVKVAGLPAQTVIGGAFSFTATFKNTGTTPGYAPYIDVIVNVAGADNVTQNGPCDGIVALSATIKSVTPANTPLKTYSSSISAPCPPNGPSTVPHPFAAWGVPPVAIGSGAQLFTFELPFGSFDPSQPPVEIAVSGSVSDHADAAFALAVKVGGGFALGATELNDSGSDPPLPVAPLTSTVTPLIATPTKTASIVENELAAGPSFTGAWTINIPPPLTPGKPLTNVTVKDCLPASTTLLTVTSNPQAVVSVSGNCFNLTYSTLAVGATITVKFHGNNTPPWTPLNACSRQVQNKFDFNASWKALDFRDTANLSMGTSPLSPPLAIKAIATQKSAKPGAAGLIPGSMITYTIDFQVSDYLRFGELQMLDTMSDGVTLSGPPRLTVSDRFGAIPLQPMPAGTWSATTATPNTTAGCFIAARTSLSMNISQAMGILAPNVFPANTLTGALAVTPVSTKAATGRIEYTVKIDDVYAVSHFAGSAGVDPDDKFVGKDDPIANSVILNARQYSTGTPPQPLTPTCKDDSTKCLAVAGGALKKTIVGKGSKSAQPQWLLPVPDPVQAPLPKFAPGDSITFLIAKTIASGDAQTIVLEDWVPKPVLSFLPAPPQVVPCNTAQPPAAGQLCYRSSNPNVAIQALPPVLAADGHLELRFKPFNNPANTPVTIEVYISLMLLPVPFADGLHLTNEVRECEFDSYGKSRCEVAVAKFEVTEPLLRITKGIVASDPSKPFTTPVAWNTPAPNPNATPRFVPPIVSPANTMNSNATADANDLLTYAIVVENLGSSINGAHDVVISDTPLPAGLTLVGNVQVTDGTGAPIATTPPNANALFTPTGIKLNTPVPSAAAGPGKNVVVITFTVRVAANAPKGCNPPPMTDTASIVSYAAAPGGPNFVAAGFGGPFSDKAHVCVDSGPSKCVVTTSEAHTTGSDVAIGEIVRYRLITRLPEGVIAKLRVVDQLPPGLQYVAGSARYMFLANQMVTQTTAVVNCPAPGNASSCASGQKPQCSITATGGTGAGGAFLPGDDPVFSFGDVTVLDNDPDDEILVIDLNAIVLNIGSNQANTTLANSYAVFSDTTNLGGSNSVSVKVVEPALKVTKGIAEGANITYPVTVTNPPNGVAAFDVTLIDIPPACLNNPFAILPSSTGGASLPVINGNLVTIDKMPPGSSATVHFVLNVMCLDCEKLINKVEVRWTSLPGANGTTSNPTGSTSGASGATDGDRTGSGGVNDYIDTATKPRCGTICGLKFHDLDGDGVRDMTPVPEPLLPGWKITAGTHSATTGNDGKYCITLDRGNYQVCETMPSGPWWKPTTPAGGCASVVVPLAGAVTLDFGNESDCYLKTCGQKFNDLNGDGKLTPGEPMLAGWTIFAVPTGGAGTGIMTTTTDAAGKWCMNLPGAGFYIISEVLKEGWVQTFPPKKSWNVTIECMTNSNQGGGNAMDGSGQPGTLIVIHTGGQVNFGNRDLCSGKCAAGTHCEPSGTTFTCVPNAATSPCASQTCPAGLQCAVINGVATCVP